MKSHVPTEQIYGALSRAYCHFNNALFDQRLPLCLITLQRQPKMMGYASHNRWINNDKQYVDELAVNPEYFLGGTLLEVLQTLVHEQCHIWQFRFGKPSRRKYHNAEWADKMESIGLMPSSTGRPGGKRTGERMADYALDEGLFLRAAKELIATGFCLPWLDRHATHVNACMSAYNRSGTPVDLTTDQASVELVSVMGSQFLAKPRSTNIHPTNDATSDVESAEEPLEAIRLVIAAKTATRVKYRCNSCLIQLWGKPGLSVVCGECQLGLAQVD